MRWAGGMDEPSVLQTKAGERGRGKEKAQTGLQNAVESCKMLRMPLKMTNDTKTDVTDTQNKQATAADRARFCVKTEAEVIKLRPVGWKWKCPYRDVPSPLCPSPAAQGVDVAWGDVLGTAAEDGEATGERPGPGSRPIRAPPGPAVRGTSVVPPWWSWVCFCHHSCAGVSVWLLQW